MAAAAASGKRGVNEMKVRILELIEGAKEAKGLAVIIDVFRAFSLECYLFDAGASRCYPIGKLEDAFAMKKTHPDYYLFGERKGARVRGCDFGNSPSQARGTDFRGKTIIHTTSAGTQGIVNAAAAGATEIMTASLVNARAAAAYILSRNPGEVSIVAMGKAGLETAGEDVLCARYLEYLLKHPEAVRHPDADQFDIQQRADGLKSTWGRHFFDAASQEVFPIEDFYLCTQCNRFPFVIRADRTEDGTLYTGRLDLPGQE